MSQARAQTPPAVIVGELGSGKAAAIKTMLARLHGPEPITVIVRDLPPASWVPSARVLGLGAAPSQVALNPRSILGGTRPAPATPGRLRERSCTNGKSHLQQRMSEVQN